ncbi:hypothetical protein [Listeria monocytogenes]|nr:hypothetical protein [Listeria monocytogenes]
MASFVPALMACFFVVFEMDLIALFDLNLNLTLYAFKRAFSSSLK